MSLKLIENEISRFLSTDTPEVLCIKGRWGVGKTYGWKTFLDAAQRSSSVALQSYSYVSLFGLNSLDDLRFAVFESTVSGNHVGSSPDATSFSKLVNKGSDFARRMKPAIEGISALMNRKGISDVLFKSAFLAVRRQIICLDDLERAGKGLHARDVLGLASLLKEERQCKVVLLLNDQEHDQKDEFERQLEKVADVTLIFDLSSQEAVSIALTAAAPVTAMLCPRIVELGITNIRVIKKIERLAGRLAAILVGLDEAVLERGIATLVLASWSVQQPNSAPPLGFLRRYNRIAIAMRARREPVDADTERYRAMIETYPFRGPEAFDHLIMDGAEAGYFKDTEVRAAAEALQQSWRQNARDGAFNRVWEEMYHGSLVIEDDVFLDALYDSACAEAAAISPLNINSAIRLLREYGRGDRADALITTYITAHEPDGPDFFDIRRHHFSRDDQLDEGLREAFTVKRSEYVDNRDPLAVLIAIGERRGWDNADIALMAKQSVDDFERLFEALRGDALRPSIEMILAIGNGHEDGADAIRAASRAALRRIAGKSPMRAQKLARYDFAADTEEAPARDDDTSESPAA